MSNGLEGVRVLELCHAQVGPAAGFFLARFGAEVIKIENTQGGDFGRGVRYLWGNDIGGPGGMSLFFESFNLCKKSVAINLKRDEGREILYDLVERSDVLLTNFRRSAQERIGITYEGLRQRNPRLVYVSISGLGPQGDEADRPLIDLAGQARSGLLRAMKRPEDEPSYVVGLADQMGAVSGVVGVLFGLLSRERQGVGVRIDGSMLGGMTWLQSNLLGTLLLGAAPRKPVDRKTMLNPLHNIYPTANGGWLALSLGTGQRDRYWPEFCEAMGLGDLRDDPRFATTEKREENNVELIAILSRVFAQHPVQQSIERLRQRDLLAEEVKTQEGLAMDSQVLANGYIERYHHPVLGEVKVMGVPIRVEGVQPTPPCPAPQLGQDTEPVLLDILGYSGDRIEALRECGAI